MSKEKFHYRGFISFTLTISFLVMCISGVVLYICPTGRIAHWTDWRLLGLTKESWDAVHTISSLLFLIVAILHLSFFNWRAFWNYIKRKTQAGIRLKKELTIALILNIIILVGSIVYVPPFSSIMDLGGQIKESWAVNKEAPPIPHAELMTLKEFAQKINVSLEEVMKKLKSKGVKIEDETLLIKEIAKQNKMSPEQLYEMIKPKNVKTQNEAAGKGYGKKTLKQTCKELNIPVDVAKTKLKEKGIRAKEGETLREISSKYNMRPTDIVDILKN